MHLHLLPRSGEATSAGTVTKKRKTVNTIKTWEPSLAGETHLAAEVTDQNESNDKMIRATTRQSETQSAGLISPVFHFISQLTPKSWCFYSIFSKKRPYSVAWGGRGVDSTIWPKLSLNSLQSSCLSLLNVGIIAWTATWVFTFS